MGGHIHCTFRGGQSYRSRASPYRHPFSVWSLFEVFDQIGCAWGLCYCSTLLIFLWIIYAFEFRNTSPCQGARKMVCPKRTQGGLAQSQLWGKNDSCNSCSDVGFVIVHAWLLICWAGPQTTWVCNTFSSDCWGRSMNLGFRYDPTLPRMVLLPMQQLMVLAPASFTPA